MSADLTQNAVTPFDAIRRLDEGGEEYWSARDLMPMLGYASWDRVPDVIERGMAAANNSGEPGPDHFRGASKMVELGSGAHRRIADYHLTRYAAYLVAMNSDPRKPAVAAAQTYFAVKTRQAEVGLKELTGPELFARAVLEAQTMLAAKDEQIAELTPKAELADAYLAADGGDRLIGQAAKLLHLKEKDLRRFLLEEHLIFVRHTKCGTPQYEPYAEFAAHFSVHETIVNHTWGSCSHLTLRAKPRGLDLIRRRLAKAGLIAIDGRVSA